MLTTLLKHTFKNGGQSQEVFIVYIAATVFALHPGKMTAIMSFLLDGTVFDGVFVNHTGQSHRPITLIKHSPTL